MIVYCTYCSAKKNTSLKTLPAIKRYNSERIISVDEAAQRLKIKFFIFSGKFGLLKSNEDIPYYDHLLQSSEVEEHAKKVAGQIEENKISEIFFFLRVGDKKLQNYVDCLRVACEKTGASFKIVEYPGAQ